MSSNNLNLNQDFNLTDKIAYFIQKKRNLLFILLGILAAILITGGAISFMVQSKNNQEAMGFYELEVKYSEFMSAEDDKKESFLKSLNEEYSEFILSNTDGFYFERSTFLVASASFITEDYEKSLELYNSIISGGKSYLVPLSYINASSVLEKQGKEEESYIILSELLNNYTEQYYDKPHVLFSMGRLQESLGNNEEALKNYKLLTEDFSNSNWTKIAINRILFLED